MNFSKLILTFFTFILGFNLLGKNELKDVVIWGNRKITWSDFKGSPPENSDYAATLSYSISLETKNIRRDSVVAYIEAQMLTSES